MKINRKEGEGIKEIYWKRVAVKSLDRRKKVLEESIGNFFCPLSKEKKRNAFWNTEGSKKVVISRD